MLYMNQLIYIAIANLYRLSNAFDWLKCSSLLLLNIAVTNEHL